MILTKEVEIKLNNNINYYLNLGYDVKNKESIIVNIFDVPKQSNIEILAKCDYCDKEVTTTYKRYTKSLLKSDKFSCCRKCGQLKLKDTLLSTYGVSNISQISSVREKAKATNLEKYGVEHYSQTKDYSEKFKNIMIEKYGVDNPMKSSIIKEKSKKTNLEKYGFEYSLQNNEIRKKSKKTSIEKYGVEFPQQSDIVKEKSKKTSIKKYGVEYYSMTDEFLSKREETYREKYGVDNPMKSDDIKKKSRDTNLEKYGVDYPTQSKEVLDKRNENNIKKWGTPHISTSEIFRKLNNKISNEINYIRYLSDGVSLFNCSEGHQFQIKYDNYHKRKKYNIDLCTICYPIGDHKSIKEREVIDFIKSLYNKEIIESYRDNVEIDIYLPDLKLGFEFNGLFWHSNLYKEESYHIDKTNHFKEIGIRIIHIWEDDWVYRRKVVESQIRNWIGCNDRKIHARKCVIKEIKNVNIVTNFLENNHIQGKVSSNLKLGLFHNNELVSVMTFDHFEGRKKMNINEWNLSRFCNVINTNVVGGASKLLKHFINHYSPERIISYADMDWSIGSLYEKLGFEKVYETKPDYKYIVSGRRIHKSRYRKSITKVSESKLDLLKIYDCGKIKFEIKNIPSI